MHDSQAQATPSTLTLADLRIGITTQARVINALVLRETKTRYGEHKLGFLWAVLEPLIMVLVFVAIFSSIRTTSPGGMPLVPFMMTGIVPFSLFRDPMTQMQGAIAQNRQLFAFPQVTTFDVIAARGLLEVVIMSGVFILLLVLAHLAGYHINIERPLGVLAACSLLAIMGVGMGFIFASISPILPSIRQISSAFLGRPLFLSSGLFFTSYSVPPVARDYLLYNPLFHMIELIRSAFFYEFESNNVSWEYASAWAVGTLALGLLVHQAMRRRAIVGL